MAAVGVLAGLAGCSGGGGGGGGDSTNDGSSNGGSSGGTSGSSSSGGNSDLGDTLNLFTWGSTYADPQFIEPFEEEYDCDVVTETFTSNADAFNKLRSVPDGTYDVVQPTNYAVERMMRNDMLAPLRLDNMPAYEEHVYDALKLDAFEEGGDVYAVPQAFGSTGLTYRTDMDGSVETPASVDVLYNDRFEGRLSTRDNAKVQIFYAALATGQDPNDPSDLDVIEEKLMEHAKRVRTFWSSGAQAQEIMTSGEVDAMLIWDGDYRVLQQDGAPIKYTGFSEGTKGWVDNQSVVKGAKHRTLAEKWIDYCASDAARDWLELTGYAIPSSATDYTEEEKETFGLTEETLESYIFQGAVSNEKQQQYDEIWTRVKSSA
jgi:spermidine/putrescine transport system substrate-binding protein